MTVLTWGLTGPRLPRRRRTPSVPTPDPLCRKPDQATSSPPAPAGSSGIVKTRHHQEVHSGLLPPARPLSDGVITLRLASVSDVAAIEGHAAAFGGLDGRWLPLEADAATERCQWIVEDWSRAWAGLDSHNGPALLITTPQAAGFVGKIGFGPRADGAIELDYGVAPRWRGRGFATRATVLATRWLRHHRGGHEVELRIARENSESRRVATKAGCRLAGTSTTSSKPRAKHTTIFAMSTDRAITSAPRQRAAWLGPGPRAGGCSTRLGPSRSRFGCPLSGRRWDLVDR